MMRPDENTAWLGFLGAAPHFAGETITAWSDGPDPPDVICSGASGKTIGVELTKWVEHTQVTTGSGRTLRENQYLEWLEARMNQDPSMSAGFFCTTNL